MKNLFYLLLVAISCGVIKGVTKEDAIGILEGFGDKCDPKPSKEDYDALITNEQNPPKTTKCLRNCIARQMEMLDGCKMSANKFKDLTSMIIEDKEEESLQIANTCNEKMACQDDCEDAHSFGMCVLQEFKTKEWPLPEFEE